MDVLRVWVVSRVGRDLWSRFPGPRGWHREIESRLFQPAQVMNHCARKRHERFFYTLRIMSEIRERKEPGSRTCVLCYIFQLLDSWYQFYSLFFHLCFSDTTALTRFVLRSAVLLTTFQETITPKLSLMPGNWSYPIFTTDFSCVGKYAVFAMLGPKWK